MPGRKVGMLHRAGSHREGRREGRVGSLWLHPRDRQRQRWATRLQGAAGPEGEGLCVPLTCGLGQRSVRSLRKALGRA